MANSLNCFDELNFSTEEATFLREITKRGLNLAHAHGAFPDVIQTQMDIALCHKCSVPMRLVEWLNADDWQFAKDFTTIIKNFNRQAILLPPDQKLIFAQEDSRRMLILC